MFSPQFPVNNDFVNFLYNLESFFNAFIEDLKILIDLSTQFVSRIPEYLFWIPDPIKVLFVAAFGVVVVYKVLGREG